MNGKAGLLGWSARRLIGLACIYGRKVLYYCTVLCCSVLYYLKRSSDLPQLFPSSSSSPLSFVSVIRHRPSRLFCEPVIASRCVAGGLSCLRHNIGRYPNNTLSCMSLFLSFAYSRSGPPQSTTQQLALSIEQTSNAGSGF